MKLISFLLSLISLNLYSQHDVSTYETLKNHLTTSSVTYDSYNRINMPLLMGNNEMGSIADPLGRGFYEMWFTDVWSDIDSRVSLPGIMFESWNFSHLQPAEYNQHLNLLNGSLTTRVVFDNDQGYESQITYLMDDKHRMVIKLINLGDENAYMRIKLPYEGFSIQKENNNFYSATNSESEFTRICWSLKSNSRVWQNYEGALNFNLTVGDTIEFIYSITTHFDSPEFVETCVERCPDISETDELLKNSDDEWEKLWKNTGFVVVPDELYTITYFRSLYWLYATSGSTHFLPAESQFASFSHDLCINYGYHVDGIYIDAPLWDMRPFTYGAAGWAAMAFNMHGQKQMAKHMLDWHYQPENLKKNVSIYPVGKKSVDHTVHSCDYQNPPGEYNYLNSENPDAMVFAHQLQMDGSNVEIEGEASWHQWQAQLTAFASAMFHQYSMYFDDEAFLKEKTYPVLRGTAEFWSELYNYDKRRGAFMLPPLNSLSEDLNEIQLIDITLGSKWNLMMAARYANQLGVDADLVDKWMQIAENVYIPQNKKFYIEYLNSNEDREGGGYMGIRGFVYLGFPNAEIVPLLNRKKAIATLYSAWNRNFKGDMCRNNFKKSCDKTMISFVAAWNALAASYLEDGNLALEISKHCLRTLDTTKTAMQETTTLRPYYLDSYAAFAMVPVSMVLQSYNGEINPFPAVPDEWKDVEFYNLPAQCGIRVSGMMKDGNPKWIEYKKDDEVIFKTTNKIPFTISKMEGKLKIK